MKYTEIIASIPRLLAARDAEDYVAGATILAELRKSFGLVPIDQRKGLTVYDRQDIDDAIDRKKIQSIRSMSSSPAAK